MQTVLLPQCHMDTIVDLIFSLVLFNLILYLNLFKIYRLNTKQIESNRVSERKHLAVKFIRNIYRPVAT